MINKELIDKINELIIQYKKTKDDKIFNKLLELLQSFIKIKVNKLYIKLKHYQIEKEDIEQELLLIVLKLIENYDTTKPFFPYFYSTISKWYFRMNEEDKINFNSLYKIDETTGEEIEIEILNEQKLNPDTNLKVEDIFKKCKTKNETKICEMYLANPQITEEEIGIKLQMTQQNISLILNKLRKRLKKLLNKNE